MFKLKDVLANKGATLDKSGHAANIKFGYQVSIRDLEVIKVRDLRKKHIAEMLSSIKLGYLGIWIDKGLAYIDNSIWLHYKKDAIKLGNENNQISIWDWRNAEAVYLKK